MKRFPIYKLSQCIENKYMKYIIENIYGSDISLIIIEYIGFKGSVKNIALSHKDIELHKFSPMILEKNRKGGNSSIILIVGSRATGKSTLVLDIMYYLREIKFGICQSVTNYDTYSKIIHPLFVYNEFDQDALNDLVKYQKNKAKNLAAKGLDLRYTPEEHVFVVLGSLAYNKAMMSHNSIREIFFHGRDYGITLIITFQYMMPLNPEFRANVDYVFVFKETYNDNIERLYKYWFGMFDTYVDFKKVLESCTNDHGLLVLDNTSESLIIENQVFWYKAAMGREYRIEAHLG